MTTQTEDIATMTDHTASVTPLGWVIVLAGGTLAADPDTADDHATYPTEAAAEAAAAELRDLNAQWWHLRGFTTRVARAGEVVGTRPVAPVAAFAPGATIDVTNDRHPAPPVRVTTMWAVRLPSGDLYAEAEDMIAGRSHTTYTTEAEAAAVAESVTDHAAAYNVTGLVPQVVSATVTTTISGWSTAHHPALTPER